MLLAIDTAANLCAACIWDDTAGKPLSAVTRDIGTGHAEQLMDVIAEALDGAGIAMASLTRLGVVVGPGSFTGVRVGVSTVRGLALGLKIPAIGVTTLEALAAEARSAHPDRPVLAVIDARRDQFYSALFAANGAQTAEPAVLDREATLARFKDPSAALVLTGSGAAVFTRALPEATVAGTAATAGIGTYAALAAAKPDEPAKPVPLYLRGADAKPQASFVLPSRTS
jgi:tRNA threonylcarbamoyladenosine biosynthesis protein TsaB